MGKPPFFMGKPPFFMGKPQFFMGKPRFFMRNHHPFGILLWPLSSSQTVGAGAAASAAPQGVSQMSCGQMKKSVDAMNFWLVVTGTGILHFPVYIDILIY